MAKDPKFALAAALLARAHMRTYLFSAGPERFAMAAAKDAADQALAEQPDLGEAHYALGASISIRGFRDYGRAQQATRSGAQSNAAQLRRGGNQRGGCATPGPNGSRRWWDWNGRRSLIRATRARRSSSARPTRNLRRYAEADQAYARAAELSADPALSQIGARINTVPLEGRSRSAARGGGLSDCWQRRLFRGSLVNIYARLVVA